MRRTKKTDLFMIVLLTICILLIIISLIPSSQDSAFLYWLPEESYFADWEITPKNTIVFRYSICFVNNSPSDETISLNATFSPDELQGWIKQDGSLAGKDPLSNSNKIIIKANSKSGVLISFEGDYLGGAVNENLSFPSRLTVMWYPRDTGQGDGSRAQGTVLQDRGRFSVLTKLTGQGTVLCLDETKIGHGDKDTEPSPVLLQEAECN